MHTVFADKNSSKGIGSFKFQYSLHAPVKQDTRFVPLEKHLAEQMIACFFTGFLRVKGGIEVCGIQPNKDDSHGRADILYTENRLEKGIQITQLQFTKRITRMAIAHRKSKEIAEALSKKIHIEFPLNINIYPTGHPHSIPMENVGKGKTKKESALIDCIVKNINDYRIQLKMDGSPIWITIDDSLISPYFNCISLNPIPPDAYSRFYGKNNLYVNYEIDNVSYDDEDIAAAIEELWSKKHKGTADILLVWADKHETMLKEREIANSLREKFWTSSFEEIFFMTFYNKPAFFKESLQIWPLKTQRAFFQQND